MIRDTDLSKKQNEILSFIKKFVAKNGQSPSVREIASSVGLSSPATVHVHIQNLIKKGYLKRDNDLGKTLELLVPNEFEVHDGDAIAVPYIQPDFVKDLTFELEHPDDYFYLTSNMISSCAGIFAMAVSQNQLSSYGILKGDTLIVEKTKFFSIYDFIVLYDLDNNIVIRRVDNINTVDTDKLIGKVIALYREY